MDDTENGVKALRHPLRNRLLRLLVESGKPTSPKELAAAVDKPLSNVSYHVRVLADCKAVTLRRTAPRRGSTEHFYVPSPKFISTPWVIEILGLKAT